MSLTSFLSDTKKTVINRLFNLRKLRPYITEKSAVPVAIYKQTILPVFDYAGFMLISCNKSDRKDLQVIQNDALRTCYNVKRRDKRENAQKIQSTEPGPTPYFSAFQLDVFA